MEENIEAKIKSIISDKFAISEDTIKPNSKFKDLGADSLDTVELIMEIENQFNIKINDDDMEKLSTVSDIIALIQSKQTQQ